MLKHSQSKTLTSSTSHVAPFTCCSRHRFTRTSRCTYVRVSAALPETSAVDKENKLSPVSKAGRFDAAARKSDELFYFGKAKAASAGKGQGFKLQVGDVVSGVVLSVKPYGAFIDVGGATGLLHVSEISNEYVVDVSEILTEGDQLKVMILMEDREQGRLTLTTKRLEKTPGDMVRNPQLVFDGADEMAKAFRARMEAIAMGADTMSMDELLGSRDGYEPMPFLPPTQTQVITSKDNTLYKF